jgi:hypothetical protein
MTPDEPPQGLRLVDARMPPMPIMWFPEHLRARKVWIGHAPGGAARCRHGALCQRGIAAFDIVPPWGVDLQADRIARAIVWARVGTAVKTVTAVKIAKAGIRIITSLAIDGTASTHRRPRSASNQVPGVRSKNATPPLAAHGGSSVSAWSRALRPRSGAKPSLRRSRPWSLSS